MARIVSPVNLLLLKPHLLRRRLLLWDGAGRDRRLLSVLPMVRLLRGRGRHSLWRRQMLPRRPIPRKELIHGGQAALTGTGTGRQVMRVLRLLLLAGGSRMVGLLLMRMLLVGRDAWKTLFRL